MTVIPLADLICPLCDGPLLPEQQRFVCANGHSFDVAKQGQLNLLPVQQKRSRDPGDSKEMVQWRRDFLNQGHYQPLAEQLSALVCSIVQQRMSATSSEVRILDAGCGEGYYINHIADALSDLAGVADIALCGVDISKWAVLAAAKRRRDIRWLVASNKALPIRPQSLDLIVCSFGFHSYGAFEKALKPGGMLLLVDTGEAHLIEMRKIIYPELKPFEPQQNALAEQAGFTFTSEQACRFPCQLSTAADIQRLLGMTPHLHRAPKSGIDRLLALPSLELTVDARIRIFTKSED